MAAFALHRLSCPDANLVPLQPRVAAGEVIRAFNESNKSPYIKRQQTIYHPGEVRLRLGSITYCRAPGARYAQRSLPSPQLDPRMP